MWYNNYILNFIIGGINMDEQYINKNIYQDTRLFSVCRAGYGKTEKTFYIERDKSYPFCNIHYIIDGEMIVEFRGAQHTVKKGQLFILPPFEAHKYWSVGSYDLELNWLEFLCGSMYNIPEEISKSGNPVLSVSESNKVNKYIKHILHLLYNEPFPKYRISKTIYSVLIYLLEASDKHNSKSISRSNLKMIDEVLQYIDGNIKINLGIRELAKVCGYSTSYFGKFFLKIVGTTPAKYILNRRISLAKEQLCQSNVKLENLALSLGFYDTSHFIRLFKKAEGLTPAEFKKQIISYTSFSN